MLFAAIAFLTSAQAAPPPPTLPVEPVQTVEFGPQGQFIVNGKLFLPIMSWAQNPDNRWNSFANLRRLNFNTFMGNQVSPLEQAEAARAVGGYGVVHPLTADKAAEIAATAGHKYILAWHHPDEPDMPQLVDGVYMPKIPVDTIAANYQFFRDQGVTLPIFLTFTAHFMEENRSRYTAARQAELYPAYVAQANVVGYDFYPIYGWGYPGRLNWTASGVRQLVQLAQGRPVYSWIETCKGSQWMTYELQPDVLPVHTRYQVWGSLIQGATAIGYFTHAWQPVFDEFALTVEMEDELQRLNAQMTRLAPAILAPPTERQISIQMTAVEGGTQLTSHFKATEHGGSLWIFAQNTDLGPDAHLLRQFDPISPRAATARINVQGLTAGTTVLRWTSDSEQTPIIAEDGYFQDTFDPLGERIYIVDPAWSLPVEAAHQIAASADDMECNQWDSSLATTYLNLPYSSDGRRAFMRWSIDIPAGATINSARMVVKSQSDYSADGSVSIQAIDSDNCPSFAAEVPYYWAAADPAVEWNLTPWKTGVWYASPDLASLVQKTIDRPGYSPGNYIGLRIRHASGGFRRVLSFDNSPDDGAYLIVNYTRAPKIGWSADFGGNQATLTDGATISRLAGLRNLTINVAQALDPATVIAGCIAITGEHGGDASSHITAITLGGDGRQIIVTFAGGLPDADRYAISLADSLRTADGRRLATDNAGLTVTLLAGDVDASGEVTAADVMAVRQAVRQEVTADNVALDVDGSGTITGADLRAVRSRIGRKPGE